MKCHLFSSKNSISSYVTCLFLTLARLCSGSTPLRFVYSNAPENLILQAREVGTSERLKFINAIENVSDDDEKMALYAEHLSRCSVLGSDISTELVELDGRLQEEFSYSDKVFAAIGLDKMSSNFFTMPLDQMSEMVQNACLKNELQFQCAYGFLDDIEKIHLYIEELKKQDGNVKIMFEKECQRQKPEAIAYVCIGNSVQNWGSECEKLIDAYNITRSVVNEKIAFEYSEAVDIIETNIAMALEVRADAQVVAKESENLLKSTLESIKSFEALKCRLYSPMERCILKNIQKTCGPDSVYALQTILRTGYLRRERGDELDEQFSDYEAETHKACQKLA